MAREDKQCLTALDQIRGLGYSLHLYLVAEISNQTEIKDTDIKFNYPQSQIFDENITNNYFENAIEFLLESLQLEGYNVTLKILETLDFSTTNKINGT